MLKFNPNKENCTGCTACMSICPKNCIVMKRDNEGFLYPFVSGNCINCGLCQHVCPTLHENKINHEFKQSALAAVSLNRKTWRASASGGAFSEICYAWGDKQTLICGASWNGLYVEHKCVYGIDEIGVFRKSKYIESNLKDNFRKIREYLNDGGKVIFSGTPCQVAGLRAFLGKDYDNLLLIDLICHGVGSQLVFNKCMESIGTQFNGVVKYYSFREKPKRYEGRYLKKGDYAYESLYLKNDQYIQLFLDQNCLRPSCAENCRFRNEVRQGDFTLADFKGLADVFPHLRGTKLNYSAIVINSIKGYKILNALKEQMDMLDCKVEDIKRYNPLFYRQTEPSDDRNKFFEEYINNPDEAIAKWTKPATIARLSFKRRFFNSLPHVIRHSILTLLKWNFTSEYDGCSLSGVVINRSDRLVSHEE